MNEGNLWEWLRDVALPLGSYSRIESPDTSPGIPDVHYQLTAGKCGHIELKATDRNAMVPFPDEEKGLHKSQLKWIKENVKHGGSVWIIAEVPGLIYIIPGRDAKHFNGATHMELIDRSIEVIGRDKPKVATQMLNVVLRMPPQFLSEGE